MFNCFGFWILFWTNPKAKYFGVSKISEDQLKITQKKNIDLEFMRKWLSPNLWINLTTKAAKDFIEEILVFSKKKKVDFI